MMSIDKVSFGTATIQKLRRAAFDGELLETPIHREGDVVEVELDVAKATIVMPKTVDGQSNLPRTASRRRSA